MTGTLKKHARRGASGVQVAVVLALISVAVIVSVKSVGTNANTRLKDKTAVGIGDPSKLPGFTK